MEQSLRIHHLAQNCAMPSSDEQPYDLVIHLNRAMEPQEKDALSTRLAQLVDTGHFKADVVHLGIKTVLFRQVSRSEYKASYHRLLIDELAGLEQL